MEAREGDLVETTTEAVFDVKGSVHPSSRVIAFIRYFPHAEAERIRNGKTFGKVYSLSERFALLKERLPQYLVYDNVFDETLCEVPVSDVQRHYKPIEKLHELLYSKNPDTLESKALRLAELLKERANISWSNIGISGSILASLHLPTSDIDPIVYGSENCRKVHSALTDILSDTHSSLKHYTQESLKALFDFRSKDTRVGFEDFVRTESKKAWQGKFRGTDYFIRFVKDWNENGEKYGDITYKNCGYAKIEATVADDSESIFTPCVYRIENVKLVEGTVVSPIEEIASFRGRFCEQAHTGEEVVAQGKVERVTEAKKKHEYYRLLLGNKPADYMIPKL